MNTFNGENRDSAGVTNNPSFIVGDSVSATTCKPKEHIIEKQSYLSWPNLPPWAIEKERESWGKRLRVLEWEDDCDIGDNHLEGHRALNGWKVRS